MDETELRRIFDNELKPLYDSLIHVEVRPTLIVATGQPGAGKTVVLASAQQDHPSAIQVIGDDFRFLHPQYWDLMRTDPLRMPDVTAAAAGAWVGMSLDYLLAARASVLMETTMRNAAPVLQTMRQFKAAGYAIEIRAVAVPEAVSRMGTLQRYTAQVRDQGSGRWAPSGIHNEAFRNMPDTLHQVLQEGLVNRIVVQQRDDITLLDINTPEHDSAHAQTLALDAIEHGRRIDHMTRAQAVMWLQQLEANARFIADADITDADLRGTIVTLQKDAEAIARVAFPRDHTVREGTLADIARAVARAMS